MSFRQSKERNVFQPFFMLPAGGFIIEESLLIEQRLARPLHHEEIYCHGLINCTDTKGMYRHQSICRLFLKTDLKENFQALICHSSRRKCIHLQTGEGEGEGTCARQRNCRKKVSDDKRSLSIIQVLFIYVYNKANDVSPRSSVW